MNPNLNELRKDPLFQLNLAIWLAQPQCSEYFYIYPLFHKSELSIYSIGPLLALPPDIRLAASGKIDCQDGARPDLILEREKKKKFCILECKKSSFRSDSSTAQQARTLLLVAGPILSEVLGLGMRGQNGGILCYLTESSQTETLETTLRTLEKEIKEKVNLESGNFGCFGVKPTESAVTLEYHDDLKKFLNLTKDSPVEIIKSEKDTDPRPLYFIPYEPSLQQQQTKEEQEFCRRILFERILSYVISNIGGATIPTTITFTTEDLLNAATFGVYEIWEDNEATKHIRRLVKNFLINIKNKMSEPLKDCISYDKEWIFDLKNKESYLELLKELQKSKPETLDLSKQIQGNLFDTLED